MLHNLLKNSFYYIPKNTFTFEVGYNQLNKYIFNNPFKHIGFNYMLEINQPHVNIFWENKSNLVNLHYKLTHYHNNRLHTMLHIQDSKDEIKEFFYVKPHAVYDDYAKIIYALEYNGNIISQFHFDTIYDSPYRNHKYAVFDKYHLYKTFSKKYLL